MFLPQTVEELVAEAILYMTGAYRTYYLAPLLYNYGDWSVDLGEILHPYPVQHLRTSTNYSVSWRTLRFFVTPSRYTGSYMSDA